MSGQEAALREAYCAAVSLTPPESMSGLRKKCRYPKLSRVELQMNPVQAAEYEKIRGGVHVCTQAHDVGIRDGDVVDFTLFGIVSRLARSFFAIHWLLTLLFFP